MKAWAILAHCKAILRHLIIKYCNRIRKISRDCIPRTDSQTSPTTNTFIMVDGCLAIFDNRCAMRTDFTARTTAHTKVHIRARFSLTVLFHLSRAGTAAHTNIFDRTAKTRHLMPLKMRERDKYVRIHNRVTNFRFLYILPVNWHNGFVRPL